MPTVLLVDDDACVRRALAALLEHALPGVDIVSCESGEAALDVLAAHPVAALVCDERMPGISGVETLKRARAISPRMPALLVSGHADLALVERAVNETRACGVLSKPVASQVFVARVRAMLDESA